MSSSLGPQHASPVLLLPNLFHYLPSCAVPQILLVNPFIPLLGMVLCYFP